MNFGRTGVEDGPLPLKGKYFEIQVYKKESHLNLNNSNVRKEMSDKADAPKYNIRRTRLGQTSKYTPVSSAAVTHR